MTSSSLHPPCCPSRPHVWSWASHFYSPLFRTCGYGRFHTCRRNFFSQFGLYSAVGWFVRWIYTHAVRLRFLRPPRVVWGLILLQRHLSLLPFRSCRWNELCRRNCNYLRRCRVHLCFQFCLSRGLFFPSRL